VHTSPLVVSPSQIYFEISNNQAITISPALEVDLVQKQCMYIRSQNHHNDDSKIIIESTKNKVSIKRMAMLSRFM